MSTLNAIALLLIVVGGINWGLVGLFDFNFVAWIFAGWAPWLADVVYVLVGIAALYGLYLFKPVTAYESRPHAPAHR